jgi:hypothetical protein
MQKKSFFTTIIFLVKKWFLFFPWGLTSEVEDGGRGVEERDPPPPKGISPLLGKEETPLGAKRRKGVLYVFLGKFLKNG